MQRLKELEQAGEITSPSPAKSKTPLQQAVQELNKAGSKKSMLQKYVTEECGIKITGNETMPVLTQRAMSHLLATVEPVGSEHLGFGKYANQTYQSVAENDHQYCQWAVTTAEEGQCSEYLRRFATWLKMMKEDKEKMKARPRAKVDLGKLVAKNKMGGYTTTGTEDPTPGTVKKEEIPTTTTSTASSSTTEAMINQLASAVQTLAQEIQAIKEEKSSKPPRKVAAKPDAEMTSDEDRS